MITYIKKPQKYTPSENPVIFQISTDNSNLVYFLVEVKDDISNDVIIKLKCYTTPDNQNGSYMNLQTSLNGLVSWQVDTGSALLVKTPKLCQSFKIRITEMILDNVTGNIVSGEVIDDGEVFIVFNAELDRISLQYYNYPNYVVTGNLTSRFLTNKPNGSDVNITSSEFLYFIQNAGSIVNKVIINTYKADVLIKEYTSPIAGSNDIDGHAFRINVSPKILSDKFLIDFDDVDRYSVSVCDANGTALTEIRDFIYKPTKCYNDPVNILFINSLGGIDSFTFNNPSETVEVSKTTQVKHHYKINSNGLYSDRDGDVYNPTEVILKSNSKSTYTVISEPLDDLQTDWLRELINTSQAFVELGDSSLVPISIKNTNYPVLQRKRSRQLMRLELTYNVTGGISIPKNSAAFGNGNGTQQMGWIDNQMYSLVNNAAGFAVITDK